MPEKILFDFDKYKLRSNAKPTLAKVNELIVYYKQAPIEIYDRTDSKGSDTYNQSLSEKRAKAVRDYLTNNLALDNKRLKAIGLGETKLIAANTNPNGSDNSQNRQKNRRVEILIRNQQT